MFGSESMTLREVRNELTAIAAAFEPSRLDARGAEQALEHAARIQKIAGTIAARAAARVDECRGFGDGARSGAHELARRTGTSVGQAVATLQTGRRLEEQPEVAAAASRGDLSAEQAAAITDALAANPNAKPDGLLKTAAGGSLGELRDECGRVKAAADRNPDDRRKRIHDSRYMRRHTYGDGSGGITIRDNPERIASIYGSIGKERERLFNEARRNNAHERSEALDLDALVNTLANNAEAACAASAGVGAPAEDDGVAPPAPADGALFDEPSATSSPQAPQPSASNTPAEPRQGGRPTVRGSGHAKVLVRVDFDALLRGYIIDGETCEIAGYGPVSPQTVTDMLQSGNAFLAAIITKGEQVVGVAHLGRRPRAVQRSAIEWLYPVCAREGCTNQRVQTDHRVPWADTKVTLLDWLDGLCAFDHNLKTHKGWELVVGTGKRAMVPPDDPRHPRHQRHESSAEPPGRREKAGDDAA